MLDIDTACAPKRAGLSRRTLVAGAAWSVPVVVGLAAVPAVAASSADRFVDSFTWTEPGQLSDNYNAFGLGYSLLSYVGSGTATGSFVLSVSPGGTTDWGSRIDNPNPSGTFTLAAGSSLQIAFSVFRKDGQKIPAGSYTVTATFSYVAAGSSHTVSQSWLARVA